uniref:NADH dehydrogenase subunit 6 n=1 Tax=Earias clorana TaxID=753175 RepID=UPI001FAF1274|nr:NADH dehydrogenase subunit 6 [Earias clorana]UNP54325.1 NADH dehydrogenase subunit 6 [Earias clorana]
MFFSIIMLFMNNPLSMGLMILIQTLLVCMLTGMMIKTYWFSYILFLTFLGGLLVLFIYVSSIASNEMFNSSTNLKTLCLLFLLLCLFSQFFFYKNLSYMNFYFNEDMENFNFILFFNNENKINLNKLYNSQTFLLMMLMMIYLFITLVSVVKITNIFYGPLRSNI